MAVFSSQSYTCIAMASTYGSVIIACIRFSVVFVTFLNSNIKCKSFEGFLWAPLDQNRMVETVTVCIVSRGSLHVLDF